MSGILCVSCEDTLPEGEDHHEQEGDTYCEGCASKEEASK